MKERFFDADPFYMSLLHSFSVKDTLIALGYYALIVASGIYEVVPSLWKHIRKHRAAWIC